MGDSSALEIQLVNDVINKGEQSSSVIAARKVFRTNGNTLGALNPSFPVSTLDIFASRSIQDSSPSEPITLLKVLKFFFYLRNEPAGAESPELPQPIDRAAPAPEIGFQPVDYVRWIAIGIIFEQDWSPLVKLFENILQKRIVIRIPPGARLEHRLPFGAARAAPRLPRPSAARKASPKKKTPPKRKTQPKNKPTPPAEKRGRR